MQLALFLLALITFSLSQDVTPPVTIQYNVACTTQCSTSGSGSFTINGLFDPTITCRDGDTITFNLDASLSAFPFGVQFTNGTTLLSPQTTGSFSFTCSIYWVPVPLIYWSPASAGMTGSVSITPQPQQFWCPATNPKWEISCNGPNGDLDFMRIKINWAYFGRTDSSRCPPPGAGGTCSGVARDVTAFFTNKCTTHYCALPVLNASVLGTNDPCDPGVSYLNMSFSCIKGFDNKPLVIAPASQNFSSRLNFLIVGDWGGIDDGSPTSGTQTAVANAMATVGSQMGISFVVGLGDNFYLTGVRDGNSARFAQTWTNPYNKAPLNAVPWYIVSGNHDHYGNIQGQLDYAKTNNRWIFPARNYDWVEKIPGSSRTVLLTQFETYHLTNEAHCCYIDSPIDPKAAADALQFLNYSLSYSHSHWRIALTHYAIYSISSHGTNTALLQTVKPLLQKGKYDFVANGHDHNHQHFSTGGVDYFVIGSGSKVDQTSTNTGNLGGVANKFFHPYLGVASLLSQTCVTNADIAFAPYCQNGLLTILTAAWGSGNTTECGGAVNCDPGIDVLNGIAARCNGKQNCWYRPSQALQAAGGQCPNGYLSVTYRCTHPNEGGFSAISVGENDMYVTKYTQSGNPIYQVGYKKPISQETPDVGRPPAPVATAVPTPSLMPTPTPVDVPVPIPIPIPVSNPVPSSTPQAPSSNPAPFPVSNPVPSGTPQAPVPRPVSTPTNSSESNSGLPGWAIALIVIGVIGFVVVMIGIVYVFATGKASDGVDYSKM